MALRFSTSSSPLGILVVTQLISLMSLIAWGAIAAILFRAGRALDVAGSLFVVYPAFPVSLSILAWFAFKLKRRTVAVVLSTIPAAVAVALMGYYYVVGLMNHG